MAVGGNTVGERLHRQLTPIAGELIPCSGHLVPLDRPDAVAQLLRIDSTAPRCG